MGVDISAFTMLAPLPVHPYTDVCVDEPGHHRPYALQPFTHALEGLPDVDLRALFSRPEQEVYAPLPACWACLGRHPRRASFSYGGYNAWRRWLSNTVLGVDPSEVWEDRAHWRDAPFYELIDFADNEGWLGPVACAALAADFAEHRIDPTVSFIGPEDHRRPYDLLAELFAHAAGGPLGAVRFS